MTITLILIYFTLATTVFLTIVIGTLVNATTTYKQNNDFTKWEIEMLDIGTEMGA